MMNVQASIWTSYYKNLSPEDGIRALIRGGFYYGDFCVRHSTELMNRRKNTEQTAREFKQFMDDEGFSVPQGHLEYLSDFTRPEVVEAHKKELDFYYAVGVRCAVVHLSGANGQEQDVRRVKNMEALQKLQDYVRGTDMTICVENMNSIHTIRDGKRIMEILKELGYTNLGVCLDTGHLNSGRVKEYTTETQREFILQAGPYLKAIHLNGNNGRSDQHLAPFCAENAPDFVEVVKALHEVSYTGMFSLENDGDIGEDVPAEILDRRLRYLRDMLSLMMAPDFIKD